MDTLRWEEGVETLSCRLGGGHSEEGGVDTPMWEGGGGDTLYGVGGGGRHTLWRCEVDEGRELRTI